MKRYKSFLLSEKLNDLILLLEGNIEYSDRFISAMEDIQDRSDVADYLLSIEADEIDDKKLTQNFIDITKDDDKVSFLSQTKFNQLVAKDEDIDPYETVRNTVKIGRVVRSLCELTGKKFSDKEIENFVNLYKAGFSDEEEFSLLSGEKIAHWYNSGTYYDSYGYGSLGNSCMRDVNSDYFDMYCNSSSCRMLILTKKGRLIGRALVWKLFQKPEGVTHFMDRIYCMKDSDENKFHKYAEKEGWLRKKRNSSDSEEGMKFILGKKDISAHIVVKVDGDYDYYPYLDTLKFLNKDKNKISNIGYFDGYVLEDTCGDCDTCGQCSGTGYEKCDTCDGEKTMDCDECYGSGDVNCPDCNAWRGWGSNPNTPGKMDCEKCSGDGYTNCLTCDGEAYTDDDCSICGGLGRLQKRGRPKCTHCKGKGKEPCSDCEDGEVKCEECEDGKVECKRCKGKGVYKCDECDGKGTVECDDCKGKKKMCPECTGLISRVK